MFKKSLLFIFLMMFAVSLSSFSASAECEHDFSGELIYNEDLSHSYYCVKGCKSYGTTDGGIYGKEYCVLEVIYVKASSCTAEGKIIRMCPVCYRSVSEVQAKTEHIYKNIRQLPTCTKQGCDIRLCILCGESERTNIVQPVAHLSDGGVIELMPTCDRDGVMKTSCRVCDAVLERRSIPALIRYEQSVSGQEDTAEKEGSEIKAPGKAVLKSVTSAKKSQAVIKWKKLSGVSGYELSYTAEAFSKKKSVKTVRITKGLKKTVKKLKSGKKYRFRIRGYKSTSYGKICGPYSKIKTVKIK